MGRWSKYNRTTVTLTRRDMSALALMLRLHASDCDEHAQKCWAYDRTLDELERCGKAARSWGRASRKARSFALQLEELVRDAENAMAPPVTHLR